MESSSSSSACSATSISSSASSRFGLSIGVDFGRGTGSADKKSCAGSALSDTAFTPEWRRRREVGDLGSAICGRRQRVGGAADAAETLEALYTCRNYTKYCVVYATLRSYVHYLRGNLVPAKVTK